MKNIKNFNLDMLFKWKWRILLKTDVLWSKTLVSRYGDVHDKILSGDQRDVGRYSESAWRKDILNVDISLLSYGSGSTGYITCSIDDGNSIPFWTAAWTGSINLVVSFPELFRASNSKNKVVDGVGS